MLRGLIRSGRRRRIGLLTVHRDDLDAVENAVRGNALERDIPRFGLGTMRLRVVHAPDVADKGRCVGERFYLIGAGERENDHGAVKGALGALGNQYGAPTALLIEHGEVTAIMLNGERMRRAEVHLLGAFRSKDIGRYYATLRGRPLEGGDVTLVCDPVISFFNRGGMRPILSWRQPRPQLA